MEYLNVVAIIVAGLMVGNELAIAVFVHPTLDRLPDDVHLPAASALARVLGRFMPFWYILSLLHPKNLGNLLTKDFCCMNLAVKIEQPPRMLGKCQRSVKTGQE